MSTPKRSPCADCPWRKDAPKGYWHPSHFKEIWTNCQDDGYHLMRCHQSKKLKKELICAGYALVLGFESVGLRIAAFQGKYKPEDYEANGIRLHESFEAMMETQGIKLPPRNRLTRRKL